MPPRTGLTADSTRIRHRHAGTAVALTGLDMRLTNHECLHPSPAVRASVSGDGLVLLDLAGGLVFSSNQVGARIWQRIEEGQPARDIARQLADDYAVPLDRAQHDVAAFVADLIARGLVTADPGR